MVRRKHVHTVDKNVIEGYFGRNINYYNSVVVILNGSEWINYIAVSSAGKLHSRNEVVVNYVQRLLSDYEGADRLQRMGTYCRFVFQGDDCPKDYRSGSWQIRRGFENVCLLPDFYYVQNNGYQNFYPADVPDWDDRESKFFWRGSTTGGWSLTANSVTALIRYRLCELAGQRAGWTDFGFYLVTQAASEQSKAEIENLLRAGGMLKTYCPLSSYVQYKFFIQIDGNGNSWELIPKLRLGSCMLLVESDWLLWHHKLLRPWEHYVPVAADLSNLVEMMDWCLVHDEEAAEIATRGRALALSINFDTEMSEAVEALAESVEVV